MPPDWCALQRIVCPSFECEPLRTVISRLPELQLKVVGEVKREFCVDYSPKRRTGKARSEARSRKCLAALVNSLSLGRRPCQTRLLRIRLNLAEVV